MFAVNYDDLLIYEIRVGAKRKKKIIVIIKRKKKILAQECLVI